MSSIETVEMKLKTTPTGGVSGEHSPYYRRLLSAGYKGFLQGTIGGAGLYGTLGAAIGLCVAIPAMIAVPGLGAAAFWFVPAAAGVGVAKGASTFGNIGSVAAISAESAELAEQRRYLLDRYYELPEGPEGDRQAELIRKELEGLQHSGKKHPLFHWKTVAVCAVIGAALALAFTTPMGIALLEGGPIIHVIHAVERAATAHFAPLVIGGIGSAIGAMMGAVIGLDRHYVRQWFDKTENLLHDDSHSQEAAEARMRQIERLKEAARIDNETKTIIERRKSLGIGSPHQYESTTVTAATTQPTAVASLDAPHTKVQDAIYQDRLTNKPIAMSV